MIDSASKRFSIMNMRSPIRRPLFIPNGTIDDGDRYHLLNLYFGIALGFPKIAINATFGLLSAIDPENVGVISLVTNKGASMLSSIVGTLGLSSPISSTGQTAYSAIYQTGLSVESSI